MDTLIDFDRDKRRLAVLGECAIVAHVDFDKTAGKPSVLREEEAFIFGMTDPGYVASLVDRLCIEKHIMIRLLEIQIAAISDVATKLRTYERYEEYDALAAIVAQMEDVSFSTWFSVKTLTSCILRDKTGYTPLMDACRNDRKSLAVAILASEFAQVGQVSRTGHTALIYACRLRTQKDIIATMLQTGLSKPGQICKGGVTALIIHCQQYTPICTEIVRLLLATGESRPGHIGPDKKTALILAATKMSPAIIDILKTGQSRPGHKTKCGNAISIVARNAAQVHKQDPDRILYRDFMAVQKSLKK